MDTATRNVMFSSKTDQHATPRAFAAEQVKRWGIVLDVCADEHNAIVDEFISEDSLSQPWGPGPCWMNPPYGKGEEVCSTDCKKKTCIKRGSHCLVRVPGIADWVAKAAREARPDVSDRHGVQVVCLLPARTDTKWWHKYIWQGYRARAGVVVEFLEGRLNFNEAESGAPFPSVLVVFG